MVFINGIINIAAYVNIRANNLTASVNRMGIKKLIFQQDDDHKPPSKFARVNFEKKDI